jgi:hypothetical protein
MIKLLRPALALGALALGTTLSSSAMADPTHAWNAAKEVLPASIDIVGGLNAVSLRESPLFKQLFPLLMTEANKSGDGKDAKDVFDSIKKECGIDIPQAIDGVVVAMEEDKKNRGALFVSLNGVNEAGVTSCLEKMVALKKPGTKITATKKGNEEIYAKGGDAEKLYTAWVAPDVFVMSLEPTDEAMLTRMLGGKGALAKDAQMSKLLGKTNTNATLWGVARNKKGLKLGKGKVDQGAGQLDLKGGDIALEVRTTMASPQEASDMARQAKQQLELVKAGAALPPGVDALLSKLTVSADGADAVAKLTASQAKLAELVQSLAPGAQH